MYVVQHNSGFGTENKKLDTVQLKNILVLYCTIKCTAENIYIYEVNEDVISTLKDRK